MLVKKDYVVEFHRYISIKMPDYTYGRGDITTTVELFHGSRSQCETYLRIQMLDAATKSLDFPMISLDYTDYSVGWDKDADFATLEIITEFYEENILSYSGRLFHKSVYEIRPRYEWTEKLW